MRILEYIKKYGFKLVTGTIAILAYKDGVYTFKEKEKVNALIQAKNAEQLKEANEIILTGQRRFSRLNLMDQVLTNTENNISTINKKLETIQSKINNKQFNNYDTESSLKTMQDFYELSKNNLIAEKIKGEHELRELIRQIKKSSSFDWI